MYIALLEHDSIKIKVDDKEIKLYRIISTKSFKVNISEGNRNSPMIAWKELTIEKHAIGGFVSSLNVFDPTTFNWVDVNAKVWGDAFLKNGSYITDTAKVYGNAVIDASMISDVATVRDNAFVKNSWISDQATVKDHARVESSKIMNFALAMQNAEVTNSFMFNGTYVMKNAKISNTIMRDTSMVGGNAILDKCTLSNRSTYIEGEHISKNIDVDVNLESVIPAGFFDTDQL